MDITTLFASLNQCVSLGKVLVEVRDQTVLNTKIIEFQNAIMAVQQQAMELQMEQQKLITRIHELESECRKNQDLPGIEYEKPYYWRKVGDKKDGPFCQSCYDKDRKLIRLQGDGAGYWECLVCKTHVVDGSYRQPEVSSRGNYNPYA